MSEQASTSVRRAKRSLKWDAELIEIIQETPDVRTFRFEKPNDEWTFEPGKYLMVRFPEKFGKKNRAYSIASAPNQDYIDLTIKLYGVFTHHMWTLREGSTWNVQGPYGHFHIDPTATNDVLLLAAGVGVTPLMSMIRWATIAKSPRKFLMLYSNKRPRDIIFHKELQTLERMNPNIKVIYTLTRLADKLKVAWPGLTGRINKEMIREHLMNWDYNHNEHLESYSCGPIPMINTVDELLTELGWPKENIKYEKFW